MFTRQIFTEEHELFREQVRRFVEREITPNHAAWEKAGVVELEGPALGLDLELLQHALLELVVATLRAMHTSPVPPELLAAAHPGWSPADVHSWLALAESKGFSRLSWRFIRATSSSCRLA